MQRLKIFFYWRISKISLMKLRSWSSRNGRNIPTDVDEKYLKRYHRWSKLFLWTKTSLPYTIVRFNYFLLIANEIPAVPRRLQWFLRKSVDAEHAGKTDSYKQYGLALETPVKRIALWTRMCCELVFELYRAETLSITLFFYSRFFRTHPAV